MSFRNTSTLLLLMAALFMSCGGGDDPSDVGVSDAPSVDAPSVDAPSVDAPSVDAPSVDAPSVDAPSVDAPSVDAPSVDAPSVDSSGETFDCGGETCTESQYCFIITPGVRRGGDSGGPDLQYSCEVGPVPCSPLTCACLHQYNVCEDGDEAYICDDSSGHVICEAFAP